MEAGKDAEVQRFLQLEQQKALMQQQVHRFTDTCWDSCMSKPRDKMDYKSEACVSNCVERYIDTNLLVTNRFQQLLQKSMHQ